jgi:bacterioferritin-associated ferredoxin
MGVDEDACLTGLAWRAVGMPQVVAGLSALCERVRARQALAPLTLVDAMAITPEDIAEVLGGLPAHKIRETLVGPRLLAQAIGDYFRRCGLAGDASGDQAGDEERLCLCLGVTGRELREAVAAGHAFEECQERLGVSTGCGSCEPAARALHAWFCAERSGASPGLVSWEEV